jgi:hypothetical protein
MIVLLNHLEIGIVTNLSNRKRRWGNLWQKSAEMKNVLAKAARNLSTVVH